MGEVQVRPAARAPLSRFIDELVGEATPGAAVTVGAIEETTTAEGELADIVTLSVATLRHFLAVVDLGANAVRMHADADADGFAEVEAAARATTAQVKSGLPEIRRRPFR